MKLATSGLTIPPANTLVGTATPAEQRLLTLAGAGSLVPLTYGRDTIGGRLLNVLPLAPDSPTLLVQVLWGYALNDVEEVRLNGAALPAGSSVQHYLGTQTVVNADLAAAMAAQGISYTQALQGYAYSVIKLPTRSVGEQLAFTGLLQGRRVYDPRKDSTAGGSGAHRLALPATWEWSDCPALCHADFLANTVYGAGEPMDWASVATTANANDELVGGLERRRIIGLSLLQAAKVDDWSETLRAYSGCWLMATAAGIKMVPDADGTPVATYAHSAGQIAALAPLELADLGDAPTVVEVVYTDTTQTPWRDATARVQLSGVGSTRPVRLSRVPLPGIHRHSQAVREATERLNKLNLQSLSTRVDLFDEGIAHQRADIIELTHPAGLSAKRLRVTDVEMLSNGQWQLAVTEHDAAVYSNSVVTRASFGDPSFVSPAGPPSMPTGLSVTLTAAGTVIRWNANPESDVLGYELRVGGTDWDSATPLVGSTPTRVGGTSYVWVPPASSVYTLRLVAVDDEGLQSEAAALSAFMALADVRSDMALPLELWQLNGHTIATLLNGKVGDKSLRIGVAPGYPHQGTVVAIDPEKVYQVRFWARPSSGCNGLLYFSLRQFLTGDINGATGPVNGGRSPYKPSGVSKEAHVAAFGNDKFGEYVYTWTAADLQEGVRYVLPEFLNNYGGTVGYWDIQGFLINEVTELAAAQAAAAAAQTSAATANAALAAISSDSVLSRGEKPQVVQDWLTVSNERAGIVAQANAYAITTQRDAYTTAHDALNTYLSGLTPAYSDTSADTAINGASFRLYWVQLYDARQVLLNKIAEVAGQRAVWASVTGSGKPADNATVGATFGVNIYGTAETVHLAATAVTNRVLFQDLTGDTRSNAT